MTQDRFLAILRCIYMCNKDSVVTDKSSPLYDLIAKIGWLTKRMRANF
jgi:hypothetical protein